MFRYNALLTVIGISIVAVNILALRYFSEKRSDANKILLAEEHATPVQP